MRTNQMIEYLLTQETESSGMKRFIKNKENYSPRTRYLRRLLIEMQLHIIPSKRIFTILGYILQVQYAQLHMKLKKIQNLY